MIKDRVEDDTGIEKGQQCLTFKETLLDDDDSTLEEYGIKNKDELKVEPFKIHVKLPGSDEKITLYIDPESTTANGEFLRNCVTFV